MQDFKRISDLVAELLQNDPRTRASDSYLYLQVLKYISYRRGYDLRGMSVVGFFDSWKDYGFPPIETVGRIRRKLQASNPCLRPSKLVQDGREELEEEFRKYARSED